MFQYKRDDDGRYLLLDENGGVLLQLDSVAMAISIDMDGDLASALLMKHGSDELVTQWVCQARRKCVGVDLATFLVYRPIDKIEIEELNRIIDTSGYIGRHLERRGYTLRRGELLPPIIH